MTSKPSTNSIIIRPMHSKDLERVKEIDQLSFSAPWPDSAYRYELNENPQSSLWVAEDVSVRNQPRVLGMIVVWFIVDEAHIATLAVHPAHRGKGAAKRLIDATLREAYQKGMQTATLEVRSNNFAAQQLYRHFGFEIVGNRPRYYRDNNEDAIIMTLNLVNMPVSTPMESENPSNKNARNQNQPPDAHLI
jgi:ribosomal-protein-alanine N-acetyltransferase